MPDAMNDDTLFPLPPSVAVPLTHEQRARLRAAGADENEAAACETLAPAEGRALLVEFFCDASPHGWRKLQRMVSLMLWAKERGHPRACGADILTNTAKFIFEDCEGNNDLRCFYTRAVAIVRPDLRGWLAMEDDGNANVLFRTGWTPPVRVDWMKVQPARLWEVKP